MRVRALLRLIVLGLAVMVSGIGPAYADLNINGSGASFPYQTYSLWIMLFNRDHKGVNVDYVAKGSGNGIKDFLAHKVDFAASDAAMKDKEIAQVKEGVQLLPMTAGQVVVVYNIPGVKQLKLSREVYSKIFLGEITNWNDPLIAVANPGLELPDLEVTAITRADSSGTTFVFTNHLCAISPAFAANVGSGKRVQWPEDLNMKKSPINAGVGATLNRTPGSIGYLDYGFAEIANLDMAILENRAGKYVMPSLASGQAALANVELPENMIAWLPDPEGDTSYPITTYTWMMFYKKYDDPAKAEVLRQMIEFGINEGQKIAPKVGYIPLPEKVVERARAVIANIE